MLRSNVDVNDDWATACGWGLRVEGKQPCNVDDNDDDNLELQIWVKQSAYVE